MARQRAGRGGGATPRAAALAVALVVVVAGSLWPSAGSVADAAPAGTDPFRDEQWGLDRLGVDQAWTVSRGAGAVVAIVDTGVALDHPDLADRFVRAGDGSVVGVDLVDGDDDPSDEHGHGTLVAGVVAATAGDGVGVAGVAPAARLLPVRVLGADGGGTSADVGRGIVWAVDRGADVVNVSLEAVAGADGRASGPGVPTDAVRYAADRGVLVVAAAGNRRGSSASYPAGSPLVLVAASDRDDRLADFSAVGREDGLLAPGVGIVSTWCRRTASGCDVDASPYGVAEGTSFAAPHVSGVAALLVAEGLEASDVHARLLAGAVDVGPAGPDTDHGAGRVDAAAALGGADPDEGAEARTASRPRRPATPTDAAAFAPSPSGDAAEDPPAPPAARPTDEAPAPTPVPTPTAGGSEPVDEPEPAEVGLPAATTAPAPDPVPLAATVPPVGVPADAPGRGAALVQLAAAVLLGATMTAWTRAARDDAGR